MHVKTAMELIEGIHYKPGWNFVTRDASRRFENTIVLRLEYAAPDTSVRYAPDYAVPVEPFARAEFPLMVGDCDDPMDLYRKVFDIIMQTEYHESREFFSVNGAYFDKPFHPHSAAGMRNWADKQAHNNDRNVIADLMFGVA